MCFDIDASGHVALLLLLLPPGTHENQGSGKGPDQGFDLNRHISSTSFLMLCDGPFEWCATPERVRV